MRLRTTRTTGPTPAERMRSIITVAHSMTVVADGHRHEVHGLDGAAAMGRVHLHEPADDVGGGDGTPRVPIRVELTDIAPAPVRERLRARVTLTGLVAAPYRPETAGTTCVQLGQAVLEDAGGRTYVPLAQLETAETDPLASCEAAMLHHLVADHPDLVTRLLRLAGPGLTHGLERALPLAIDRYGITLRLEHATAHRDIRLPFPTAITDVDQVGLQIHALLTAARRAAHSHLSA
ncbi:DUF2470 domain-containing protein [Streptomyces sp. R302]|uniref:DUF2470 domain-containing protein n=1 Tax=unclassified Streptomyces TaxID=2593676 RepID=UPI00145EFFE1|nr:MULTISPECIES: DUF2470 domain-containing protein [unclassified Streptomyces]NML51056.1 DUF2470 domain-containing protein [Streptomyces sp. R301]NML81151.1 DUF2470 domain-containing protein [Streptomyces sp. R302]